MKSKIGRPKLEVTRTVLIGARFAPKEAKLIEAAARHTGQVKSKWIRESLLRAAGRPQSDQAVPSARQVVVQPSDAGFLD